MTNFIDDNTTLPTGTPDFDTAMQALYDSRGAIQRGYGFLNVRAFGAIGDGTTDDWAAFDAAIRSMSTVTFGNGLLTSTGRTLFVPRGVYRLSKSLEVSRICVIQGDGAGVPNSPSPTRLVFDAGHHGLVFSGLNTSSDGGVANGSTLRNLGIEAAGNTSKLTHGIQVLAPFVEIDNCFVGGFKGDGIHLNSLSGVGDSRPNWVASTAYEIGDYVVSDSGKLYSVRVPGTSASSGGPTGTGDSISDGTLTWRYAGHSLIICDSWVVRRCFLVGNQRHGLFTMGGDSQVGVCDATAVLYNGGWGVYESSFLGNTYTGMFASDNVEGPYLTNNANGSNVFINCYSEGGQPPSQIVSPTQVYGGLHGAGVKGNFSGLIARTMKPFNVQVSGPNHPTDPIPAPGFRIGGDDEGAGYNVLGALGSVNGTNNLYFRYAGPSAAGPAGYYWFDNAVFFNQGLGDTPGLQATGIALEPHVNRFGRRPRYLIPGTLFTFPISAAAPSGGGGGIFNEGTHVGHNNGLPTGGMWHEGDISFNTYPTAGGPVGYVCISPGTCGTYGDAAGPATATAYGTTTIDLSQSTNIALGLQVGDRVLINGVDTFITAITSPARTQLTVANPVPAGTSLTISYVTPTFQPFGEIAGGAASSTGSPGAATLNAVKGRSAIAAGSSSVVITNSQVTSSSIIHATLQSVDATLTELLTVSPGSGSFTVRGNANATAPATFAWSIEQ